MGAAEKGEKTRQRLVAEADRLFFTRGFSSVSMDELARSLRMSKKTLYRMFPSKQELLRAVLHRLITEAEQSTDAIFNDGELSFVEKLDRLLALIGTYVIRLRQPILDDIRRSAMDVWEEFDAWRQQRVLGKFGKLIRQGIDEGMIRQDLDPQVLTMIHAAAIRGVMNPEALVQLPLSASQAFQAVIAVIFQGILSEKARAECRRNLGPNHQGLLTL